MSPFRPIREVLGALALLALSACNRSAEPQKEPPPPPEDTALFPSHEPPPTDELIEQATKSAPPKGKAEPYEPEQVEVPPLEKPNLDVLPKSPDGLPMLQRERITGLAVDEKLADPVTAMGRCLSYVLGCVQPDAAREPRSFDSCVASARTCAGNQPWAEAEACCPASCQDLYRELRLREYSQSEAWIAVGASECTPGLREFVKEAK